MGRDLKTKLHDMSHEDLMRWLSWIVAFAGGVVISAFGIYFWHFASNKVSSDPAVWGQFGDFVGGAVNPIIGFLSLIAIILTIILQNRQIVISAHELELSRKELEATRKELRRSAEAQWETVKAQTKQALAMEIAARISAIDRLLNQADETLNKITPFDISKKAEKSSAEKTKQYLTSELNRLFTKLSELDGTSST